MQWIARNVLHGTKVHGVHPVTSRVQVKIDGDWKFRATTMCGITITGMSGGAVASYVDCRNCRRSGRWAA